MKIFTSILIGALFTLNIVSIAQADIKFIPKEGKLWVKATGEVMILKDSETNIRECALRLEDKQLYILMGEFSQELQRLEGKIVEVEGLLRPRIKFGEELIPCIEVKRFKRLEEEE